MDTALHAPWPKAWHWPAWLLAAGQRAAADARATRLAEQLDLRLRDGLRTLPDAHTTTVIVLDALALSVDRSTHVVRLTGPMFARAQYTLFKIGPPFLRRADWLAWLRHLLVTSPALRVHPPKARLCRAVAWAVWHQWLVREPRFQALRWGGVQAAAGLDVAWLLTLRHSRAMRNAALSVDDVRFGMVHREVLHQIWQDAPKLLPWGKRLLLDRAYQRAEGLREPLQRLRQCLLRPPFEEPLDGRAWRFLLRHGLRSLRPIIGDQQQIDLQGMVHFWCRELQRLHYPPVPPPSTLRAWLVANGWAPLASQPWRPVALPARAVRLAFLEADRLRHTPELAAFNTQMVHVLQLAGRAFAVHPHVTWKGLVRRAHQVPQLGPETAFPLVYGPEVLIPAMQPRLPPDYSIVRLTNLTELQAEARAMRNCLKDWGPRCAVDRARVYSVRHESARAPIADLAVEWSDSARAFQRGSLLAHGNQPAPPWLQTIFASCDPATEVDPCHIAMFAEQARVAAHSPQPQPRPRRDPADEAREIDEMAAAWAAALRCSGPEDCAP